MIKIVRADITSLAVDAIVNAANETLLGGGGVDGAIHRAAGPELRQACQKIGGCPTGEARITRGFRLPATWVIHTVGPVWQGGDKGEPDLLVACYKNSFDLALQNGVSTIAFPSISTGAYGYPIEAATGVAVGVMRSYEDRLEETICCCFSDDDGKVYELTISAASWR
ncbi:MAG: O-acetyl-ADP-ribose deacetylase [Proteobacteria bacterium]|nr:O-acetyl-ADP-ribose deacetylase [Pseudomonadota bacterium]